MEELEHGARSPVACLEFLARSMGPWFRRAWPGILQRACISSVDREMQVLAGLGPGSEGGFGWRKGLPFGSSIDFSSGSTGIADRPLSMRMDNANDIKGLIMVLESLNDIGAVEMKKK